MAFLVQLILPAYDDDARPLGAAASQELRRELTERFGGMTAYTRAPAEGTWEDPSGRTHRDDVVIVEVMTETLDRDWWRRYSTELAARFHQEQVAVRAIVFDVTGA